jgi:hypothetical protein
MASAAPPLSPADTFTGTSQFYGDGLMKHSHDQPTSAIAEAHPRSVDDADHHDVNIRMEIGSSPQPGNSATTPTEKPTNDYHLFESKLFPKFFRIKQTADEVLFHDVDEAVDKEASTSTSEYVLYAIRDFFLDNIPYPIVNEFGIKSKSKCSLSALISLTPLSFSI